jgi:hypothetical protein
MTVSKSTTSPGVKCRYVFIIIIAAECPSLVVVELEDDESWLE